MQINYVDFFLIKKKIFQWHSSLVHPPFEIKMKRMMMILIRLVSIVLIRLFPQNNKSQKLRQKIIPPPSLKIFEHFLLWMKVLLIQAKK